MKLIFKQSAVFLSVALLLPVVGSAQNRGGSIAPEAVGGETESFSKDGNKISVTKGNGYQTISVKESDRDIEIVIHADGRIKVDVTRQFGPDELDRLARRAPELEKYLQSFPKQVGNKSVRLSVGLTTTFEGRNAAELREKDLAAFNLYKRYAEESSKASLGDGGNGPGKRWAIPSTRSIGPAIPGIDDGPESGNPSDPDPAGKKGDEKKNKGQQGTGIG